MNDTAESETWLQTGACQSLILTCYLPCNFRPSQAGERRSSGRSTFPAQRIAAPGRHARHIIVTSLFLIASTAGASPAPPDPRKVPNAPAANGAPAIDYGTIHRIVEEAAREQTGDRQPDASPALSAVERFREGAHEAERRDCKTAHAGKGLIGLPFLLLDTLWVNGCRW